MLATLAVQSVLVFLLLAAGTAVAADQEVLGRKLLVRDPTGMEPNRLVSIQGKERPTSMTLVGDPTVGGATLDVIANGGTGSAQHLTLDAAGWSPTPTGFTYRGPTTGDPVRKVTLKLTPTGVAILKVVLKGNVGTSDLALTPPDPGDGGGLVLAIAGGDRYCVSLGGSAGGTERQDTASLWLVTDATDKPGCPASTTPTTSSTIAFGCSSSGPVCGGSCPAGYHCENVGGGSECFCFTGGTDECANCDTPCNPGDVCAAVIDITPPEYLVSCGCVTPPVCAGAVCGANCPPGGTCLSSAPGSCFCGSF
jgi:hypothetical protein